MYSKYLFTMLSVLIVLQTVSAFPTNSECNITYELMNGKITTTELNASIVDLYTANWQNLCSELINRTIEEKSVCEKIYYFQLQKVNNLTEEDINKMRTELSNKVKISYTLMYNYVQNYNEKCYKTGLAPKQVYAVYNETPIPDTPLYKEKCDIAFDNILLEASIPTPEIYLSNNLSCKAINTWKWFVSFEEKNDCIFIKGIIKIWTLVVFALLLLIIAILRIRRINKLKGGYLQQYVTQQRQMR